MTLCIVYTVQPKAQCDLFLKSGGAKVAKHTPIYRTIQAARIEANLQEEVWRIKFAVYAIDVVAPANAKESKASTPTVGDGMGHWSLREDAYMLTEVSRPSSLIPIL